MLPGETKHTTMVENLSYPEVASVQIIILRNLSSLLLYTVQQAKDQLIKL